MKKVLLLTAGLILSAGVVNAADYDRDSGPYWTEEDAVGIDAGDRKYDPEAPGWWAGYYEHHWQKHHAKKPKSKEDMVKDAKKAVEDAEKVAGEITDPMKKTHAENALAHAKLSLDQLEKGDEKDARGNAANAADVRASTSKVKALHRGSKAKKPAMKKEEGKKEEAKKEEPKKEEKKSEAKKEEKKEEKKS